MMIFIYLQSFRGNTEPLLPRVLLPRETSAVEARRVNNIITQVVRRARAVDRVDDVDLVDHDAGAGARGAALDVGDDVAGGGARPVEQAQVADVELARVAAARRRVVARALRDGEDAGRVLEDKVLEGDVGGVAEAAAAAVGRVAGRVARPRLDVGAVAHVLVDGDVADGHVLDGLELAVWRAPVLITGIPDVGARGYALTILPDTADGNAETSVEITVLNENVGAVGLHCDAVIAVVYDPVTECNVVRVDGVGSVSLQFRSVHSHSSRSCVGGWASYVQGREVKANRVLQIRAVDVDVLQEYVLSVDDCHCPRRREWLFRLNILGYPGWMGCVLTTFDSEQISASQ